MKLPAAALPISVCLCLAGCGGGGSSAPSTAQTPPSNSVPVSMNVLVPSGAAGDPNIKQYLMNNSTVSGASFQVQWSNVDQGPSAPQQYDFTFVDNEIQPWISAGKKVNLIVWANADSSNNTCTNGGQNNTGNCAIPAYVWTALGPANFTMCTPNNAAGPQQIPNYLDVSGFQTPYQNFMAGANFFFTFHFLTCFFSCRPCPRR